MMPPPIPMRPERKPIITPIAIAVGVCSSFISPLLLLGKKINRAMGIKSKMPNNFLYKLASKEIIPPKKDMGIDASAKGKKYFHLKYPPRKKNINAVNETKRFNNNAVGFIKAGIMLKSAIRAK